jgi:UDP-N-acetylmuramoylalanine--D-glutamate ligase
MIAGGKDKGSDFSLIKGLIKEKVKELIVIGQAKQKIRHALEAATKIKEADSLKKAISLARKDAIKGDCVLLSPMCASFDMFRDFEHRGKVFKNIVKEIR